MIDDMVRNLITDITAAISEAEAGLLANVRNAPAASRYQQILGNLRAALHSMEVVEEIASRLPHPLDDLTNDYGEKQ